MCMSFKGLKRCADPYVWIKYLDLYFVIYVDDSFERSWGFIQYICPHIFVALMELFSVVRNDVGTIRFRRTFLEEPAAKHWSEFPIE